MLFSHKIPLPINFGSVNRCFFTKPTVQYVEGGGGGAGVKSGVGDVGVVDSERGGGSQWGVELHAM